MLPHPHVLLQKLYLSISIYTFFMGGGLFCIICSGQENKILKCAYDQIILEILSLEFIALPR